MKKLRTESRMLKDTSEQLKIENAKIKATWEELKTENAKLAAMVEELKVENATLKTDADNTKLKRETEWKSKQIVGLKSDLEKHKVRIQLRNISHLCIPLHGITLYRRGGS